MYRLLQGESKLVVTHKKSIFKIVWINPVKILLTLDKVICILVQTFMI